MSNLFFGDSVNEILPLFEAELTEQDQFNALTAKVITLLIVNEVNFPYYFQQHLDFALTSALRGWMVFELIANNQYVATFIDKLGDYVTSTYTIQPNGFEIMLTKGDKEEIYHRKLTRHSLGLLLSEVE